MSLTSHRPVPKLSRKWFRGSMTSGLGALSFAVIVMGFAPPLAAQDTKTSVKETDKQFVAFVRVSDPKKTTPPKVTGSAVLITSDGWLLTAAHLFENIDKESDIIEISFTTKDNPKPAHYFGCDPFAADFCLLLLDRGNIPFSNADLEKLPRPKCRLPDADAELTMFGFKETYNGVTSATGKVNDPGLDQYFKLETDARGQPGMSGGPVVDEEGKLVGLVYAGITPQNGETILAYSPIKFARVLLQAAGVDCPQ
jgi:S1-C subfamily serine protease